MCHCICRPNTHDTNTQLKTFESIAYVLDPSEYDRFKNDMKST